MDGSTGRPSGASLAARERNPNDGLPDVPAMNGRGGRGARVGLVIGLALAVGFAGLLGVRVKQAVGKKNAVAGERAAAQERVSKKEPSKTVHPTT
ncbi:hypothetical protein, partial [Escherichia coli]|uniref:hypothetical protein n=1 Tax=Escherichia coli TaxID=562 RepID=UPI00159B90C3